MKNKKQTTVYQDNIIYVLVAFIASIGIAASYWLRSLSTILSLLILVLFLTIAIAILFKFATATKPFTGYLQDSWHELQKVVWPSHRETLQFIWIIIIIVGLLSIFLWLLDNTLTWLLYKILY